MIPFVSSGWSDGRRSGIDNTTHVEHTIVRAISAVLERTSPGGTIDPDDNGLRLALPALESLAAANLREVCEAWRREDIDGFLIASARSTDPQAIELVALVVLLSDQTLTPFHLRLGITPMPGEVTWSVIRLGERGNGVGGIRRVRPASVNVAKWLHRLAANRSPLDKRWACAIEFGRQLPDAP
jgi:hypothetical protein